MFLLLFIASVSFTDAMKIISFALNTGNRTVRPVPNCVMNIFHRSVTDIHKHR